MVETDAETAFEILRLAIYRDFVEGRARSLVLTKIEEAELWLTRCTFEKS